MSSNAAAPVLLGKTLGHYRFVEKIGSGGMGDVFRARDEHLNREVAIKILPSGTLADDFSLHQFRQEAIALSRVNHSNIATIHDFDTQQGVGFLVMEFIPGVTLNDKLGGRALPEKDLIDLGVQIASGLEEAHEQGVLHKDIKSRNIMVTPKGLVKILDFGLAKIIHASSSTDFTVSRSDNRTVAGTYPYMSPEQLRGEAVDMRSDIYSFGIVLYEMATGQLPFRDQILTRLIDAILNRSPDSPSSLNPIISRRLERLILKAVDKNPEHRYQLAREMRVDLQGLITSISVQPTPGLAQMTSTQSSADTTLVKTRVWWRSRKSQLVTLLSLLISFAVFATLYQRSDVRDAAKPLMVERQLTSNSPDYHVLTGDISPDGEYLAYLDTTGLFVRGVRSGQVHQVQLKEDIRKRLWGFVWNREGGELLATLGGLKESESPSIWIIPLVGQGEPRKLLDAAENPSISPDGEMIAFVKQFEPLATEIWVSKINGEAAQKWLSADSKSLFSSPAWSPDGRWIVYEKTNRLFSNSSIEMRALAGGIPRTVFSESSLPQLGLVPYASHPLSFLPDWRLLFVAMQRPDFLSGAVSLWRIAVDPSRVVAGQLEKIAEWPDLDYVGFSIAGHGERLALLKQKYESGIYVGRLQRENVRLNAVHRLTADTRTSFPTGWTSDSQQLLFASLQTGTPKIFKQQIDNSVAERVTSGSGSELGPQMSPDNTSILYAEYSGPKNDPRSTKLMSISAAGAQPRVLLETKGAFDFHCPHVPGTPCVVSENEGDKVIFYSLDPVHGRGRQLATCNKEDALDWSLSSDGLRLATLGVDNRIAVLNLKITDRAWHQIKFQDRSVALDMIAWRADGTGFFSVGRSANSMSGAAVLSIGFDGRGTLLWRAPLDRIVTSPVASPNGHYLAFGVTVLHSNISLLENF